KVCHDPWARAKTLPCYYTPKPAQPTQVDGLHVTVAVVQIVGLGVAVIKAAAAVDMRAAGDHIHTFGCGSGGDTRCRVAPIANASRHENSIDRMAADAQGER